VTADAGGPERSAPEIRASYACLGRRVSTVGSVLYVAAGVAGLLFLLWLGIRTAWRLLGWGSE
jgi:hypothetical protein